MNELHLPGLAPLAAAWAARGWLALLALTVAVLFVAALRKPCRRWFGAGRAFQLWLLPPLALLASQLPHAAAGVHDHFCGWDGGAAGGRCERFRLAHRRHAAVAGRWRRRSCAGRLAQRAFRRRLRGATPMADARSRRPVLRATRADVGPALVGAWRSRIVLPVDFAERYDTTEQALILAHEDAHARRGDGWWCLFAQLLAALFWCQPLAWWALAALRHDQELACDAAVLRGHGAQRRSYANAMLKTRSAAFALPVGCAWSPRHPLTERIAMLKQHEPGRFRRRCGSLVVVGVALAVASTVYAATQPASPAVAAGRANAAGRYALKLALGIGDKPPRLHATMCLKPGQFYDVTETDVGKLPPWHGRFTVVAAEHGQLEVQASMSGGPLAKPGNPKIRMLPGQQGTIQVGSKLADKDGEVVENNTIKIDLTPSIGC